MKNIGNIQAVFGNMQKIKLNSSKKIALITE